MLLTVYYMAATWLQSWRLNSMRTKIGQLRKKNGSLFLFKSQEPTTSSEGLQINSVYPTICTNSSEAHIGDLLCYSGSKNGISLYPLQVLDTSNWIGVPNKKTVFPVELQSTSADDLSEQETYHVVLEADFNTFNSSSTCNCQVEDFGVPRAWLADDLLLLLLESNEDQLSKLAAFYMSSPVSIGPGLELLKILTVETKGKPCLLLNSESIPVYNPSSRRGTSVRKRAIAASQWQSHVNLLRSFSKAAAEASKLQAPASVPDHRSVMLVPGSGAGYTPMEEMKTLLDGVMDERGREVSDPLAVTTPVHEEPPSLASEERSVSTTSLNAQPGSTGTGSSFGSLSTLLAASTPSRAGLVNGNSGSIASLRSASTTSTPKHIRVTVPHHADTTGKPPNVIVFSESSVSAESVKKALATILHKHRYTVYSLNLTQMTQSPWLGQATLVVVCGSVHPTLAPLLLQYVLCQGGSLLCLCSDLLGVFLPIFRTAEVRPDQLVTFSYSHWKHVRMMHHIFCYQLASSAKFSSSMDESSSMTIPSSVDVLDDNNKMHTLSVKVLGVEETWQTPSLLYATEANSGGKVVFSQVHLEADPSQYESDEEKLKTLKESNSARMGIFADLLSTHLGLDCTKEKGDPKYSVGYFLGSHELKQEFMNKLKNRLEGGNTLKMPELSLKFCGKGVTPSEPSAGLLPVLMYSCPESFSTVSYFDNLESKTLGRLVIFSKVMTTGMAVLAGAPLAHGLAVIPLQQTAGIGRMGNVWLSPEGCAMFCLQLHIPLKSELGHLLPFLQHTVALSIVSSVCSLPGLDVLDLGLKWPNDIYAGSLKVGGLIVTSVVNSGSVVCNIGCGFNLDNKLPTVCINDMITQMNKATNQKLPLISKEKFFAIVFSQLEKLLLMIEMGQQDKVLELYYKYWLHSGAEVDVVGPDGSSQHVTIVGVDNYGFLRVQSGNGTEFTVQPDGNSFDMLAGLISPKVQK